MSSASQQGSEANNNPILDTVMYLEEFPEGAETANSTAENM
jgi:hypothetical protein